MLVFLMPFWNFLGNRSFLCEQINDILNKNPWLTLIFIYEELDLLTFDQLSRLSKLQIDVNDIVDIRCVQSKNPDFSFLDVLQLLVSNNEHLLADKLKMCNYKLNRAVFSATSVCKYLRYRYVCNFKFRKLNNIDHVLIKTNHFFDEPAPIFKSHDGFLPAIKFFSNAERLLLSDYEVNALSNININMSIDFYIHIYLTHSKCHKEDDDKYEDLSFDFLSVLLLLSVYDNTHKVQLGLNYQIILCNYGIDRSTFKARSVIEYLALQNHRSYEFEYLIFFININIEGTNLKKQWNSVKNKA